MRAAEFACAILSARRRTKKMKKGLSNILYNIGTDDDRLNEKCAFITKLLQCIYI